MRDEIIDRVWQPAAATHAALRKWSGRKLDELCAPDRFIYITACADLAMHPRLLAQVQLSERLYVELPGSIQAQVRPLVGKMVIDRCSLSRQSGAPLLAIDLIIDAMRQPASRSCQQGYDEVLGISETLLTAVVTRRRQLGCEFDERRPFAKWREEQQDAFVNTFHDQIWAPFQAHDDDNLEAHAELVEACEWDVQRAFYALGSISEQVEAAVKLAMGRRIYDLAREYKLSRLPRGHAIDLLGHYIADKIAYGAKLDKILSRLEPALREQLGVEFEPVEQEEDAREG